MVAEVVPEADSAVVVAVAVLAVVVEEVPEVGDLVGDLVEFRNVVETVDVVVVEVEAAVDWVVALVVVRRWLSFPIVTREFSLLVERRICWSQRIWWLVSQFMARNAYLLRFGFLPLPSLRPVHFEWKLECNFTFENYLCYFSHLLGGLECRWNQRRVSCLESISIETGCRCLGWIGPNSHQAWCESSLPWRFLRHHRLPRCRHCRSHWRCIRRGILPPIWT